VAVPVTAEGTRLKRLPAILRVFRLALILAHNKGCFSTAKGAAYSGLLALFPVLSAVAAVLVHLQAGPVLQLLTRFLRGVLPPGTETLVLSRFAESGDKPLLLLALAVFLAAWAGSGLMLSLMEGFDAVYHVAEGRPFLRQRLRAGLLTFATAIPALVATVLVAFGSQLEDAAVRWLAGSPEGAPLAVGLVLLGAAVRFGMACGTVVLVTCLLYLLGPNRRQSWGGVWPGAITATVLWMSATAGFGWYVRNLANYNVMYGSLAAVIALLAWMYVMAAVAGIGCAYNAVLERTG